MNEWWITFMLQTNRYLHFSSSQRRYVLWMLTEWRYDNGKPYFINGGLVLLLFILPSRYLPPSPSSDLFFLLASNFNFIFYNSLLSIQFNSLFSSLLFLLFSVAFSFLMDEIHRNVEHKRENESWLFGSKSWCKSNPRRHSKITTTTINRNNRNNGSKREGERLLMTSSFAWKRTHFICTANEPVKGMCFSFRSNHAQKKNCVQIFSPLSHTHNK